MFGVDSIELLIVAIAALLFIGPKDLPHAMRGVGQWVGKVRGMARHFKGGIQTMMREAELEEMERKWREDNQRIMSEFPATFEDLDTGRGELDPGRLAPDLGRHDLDSGRLGPDPTQIMLPLEPPPEIPPSERPLP